ncbi:hypothetical protein Rs2_44206 [Raphanus sativus]|nr:hypothetical protein Rs2_49511 [Raphanus sativus]KAJ4874019.1 hypothetical protein Rs2_44206 [Raphanus sativus]
MEGDTPDAKKNKDQLMNVNSSKSRNLLRKKDGGCLAVLSSGKCLQIFQNSPKVSCSGEFSTSSPSHLLRKLGANYDKADQSRKVISLSSNNTFSSPSTDVSQGTLQFTTRANGIVPRFVFKLDNEKDVYVASLSSNVVDQSVSTLSSCSFLNERFVERQFVLFSNDGEHSQTPCRKKNRGSCKKVVGVMKNNEQMQQPNSDHEQFLRKSSLVKTESGSSRSKTSVDVVIPSGIHGGPEDGPSSLIERWKSQGNCDCGGWDLGCSLTLLKGQPRKDNLSELLIEGSKHEKTVLRIEKLRRGRYLVQLQTWLSVLQSFSIAIAFIHSQSQELLRINL